MLDLRNAKRIVVLGGGTAGWFAALTLQRVFPGKICVIESPEIPIVGVGEGGLPNFLIALQDNGIDVQDFINATGAAHKWGFSYEGWRTGEREDQYFHLYHNVNTETYKRVNNFHPNLAAMINKGIPMHTPFLGRSAIEGMVSQAEATEALIKNGNEIVSSLHFDSYKTANYLKEVAISRGIDYKQQNVLDSELNDEGCVTTIITDVERIEVDFVIDASGLRRVFAKKMGMEWVSFSEYLLLDRAIPFYIPHPNKNPYLYTRAIAMDNGWIWQIPLQDRVGAGYVYSSKHCSDEQAHKEIEAYLGVEVEGRGVIKFEPGCHKEIWKGNVMALGLSAGFVEPLEATSIGQMLTQLNRFAILLMQLGKVIPQYAIDKFNEHNLTVWYGIRDFLRMHYDTPRRDTLFWQDIAKVPYPPEYAELKKIWQTRNPRREDIQHYGVHYEGKMFGVTNWILVAGALGVIPPEATGAELSNLPHEEQVALRGFLGKFKPVPKTTGIREEGPQLNG